MKHLFPLSVCTIFLFQISECMLQKHSYPQKRIIPSKSRYSAVTTTDHQKHLDLYLSAITTAGHQEHLDLYLSAITTAGHQEHLDLYRSKYFCKFREIAKKPQYENLSLPEIEKAINQMRDKVKSSLNSTQVAVIFSTDQQSTLAWFLLPTDILKIISEYICDNNPELINCFNEKPIRTILWRSLMQDKLNNDKKLAKIYSVAELCFVPPSAINTLFDVTKHFAKNPKKQFLLSFQAIDDLCKLDNKILSDDYFKNKLVQTSTCKYIPSRRNHVYSLTVFSNYLKNPLAEKPINQARTLSLLISSEKSDFDFSLDCDIFLWNAEDKHANRMLCLIVGFTAYIGIIGIGSAYIFKNYCI